MALKSSGHQTSWHISTYNLKMLRTGKQETDYTQKRKPCLWEDQQNSLMTFTEVGQDEKVKKITITVSYLKAQKAHWKNNHMVAKWKQPMRHDEILHSWWPLSSAITGNPAQTTSTNPALLVSMKKWVWKHEKMCLQSCTRIGMSE